MTTEETIRAAVEAYDAGDQNTVDALIDDNVTYRINSHDGPYRADCRSKDEFWEAVGAILADWDIQSYKIHDLIVSGNKGAAQIRIEMISRHTGRPVQTGLALFLEVANDRLTEIHEYHDTRAIGMSQSA